MFQSTSFQGTSSGGGSGGGPDPRLGSQTDRTIIKGGQANWWQSEPGVVDWGPGALVIVPAQEGAPSAYVTFVGGEQIPGLTIEVTPDPYGGETRTEIMQHVAAPDGSGVTRGVGMSMRSFNPDLGFDMPDEIAFNSFNPAGINFRVNGEAFLQSGDYDSSPITVAGSRLVSATDLDAATGWTRVLQGGVGSSAIQNNSSPNSANEILIQIDGLRFSTDATQLLLQVVTGSSPVTTMYAGAGATTHFNLNGSAVLAASAHYLEIRLARSATGWTMSSNLADPLAKIATAFGHVVRNSTDAVNGFRLFLNDGASFAGGTIRMAWRK